jgi:serine-type D-Ala-D-Ala carboxypeptidase/endopeptidase (penicillin-binding protein 4)
VVADCAGVALDEGSRIPRRNRLTVRGLVKVFELFAPGTDLLRRHHGGHEQDRHHRRIPHARDLYRTPQATGGYLVISLMSNDGEIRFRLLRAVVKSEL